MHEYHYSLEGKTFGPVSLEQLKALNIKKDTLVWRDGLANWVMAGSLDELKNIFKASPPPLQATPPPLNRPTSGELSQKDQEKRELVNKKTFIWLGIAVGLLVLILLITNIGNSNKKNDSKNLTSTEDYPNSETSVDVAPAAPAAESYQNKTNMQTTYTQPKKEKTKTQDQLNLELSHKEINNPASYITASFTSKVNLAANTVLEGQLYSSASLANFQNVLIKVRFYSKSGEELNSENFTISEFLPAGGSAYFKHKVYGWTPKVDHLDYTIISAEGFYDEPCRI
jgi:hypothetical protein